MLKTRVFGEFPEGFMPKGEKQLEAVERWLMLDRNGKSQRSAPRGPEQRAALNDEDLMDLLKILCGPDSDEDEAGPTGKHPDGSAPAISEKAKIAAGGDGAGGGEQVRIPVSVDVPLLPMSEVSGQHWQIGGGVAGKFGTRRQALNAMGTSIENNQDDGSKVGVIIVDVGLNACYVNGIGTPDTFGGGWQRVNGIGASAFYPPGQYQNPTGRMSDGHGNMIARNILSVAPSVMVYDAPILPDRVLDVAPFASSAHGLFQAVKLFIVEARGKDEYPDHWIIVNAWGVATSFADSPGPLSYAGNREHLLNEIVIELANMDDVDVVFAAGNSGAFQPARFAGPYDRGHGRSIWGANGLEEVFTIGAVRCDGLSIGASSQGPAPQSLLEAPTVGKTNEKPDLCAPSWFAEDDDPSLFNTGTSAASAMFAGFLAAERSRGLAGSSAVVKSTLIQNASRAPDWIAQRGYGTVKPTASIPMS